MKTLKILFAAMLMMPMTLLAQNQDPQEILKLSDQRVQYQLTKNWDDFISLFADDAKLQHGFGGINSKEDYYKNLQSGFITYTSIELQDRDVKFYGCTATVTGRMLVSIDMRGEPSSYDYHLLEVYTWMDGTWKLVYCGYRDYKTAP
jgi:hypothetical protein